MGLINLSEKASEYLNEVDPKGEITSRGSVYHAYKDGWNACTEQSKQDRDERLTLLSNGDLVTGNGQVMGVLSDEGMEKIQQLREELEVANDLNKTLRDQVKQWERVPSLKQLKEENERLPKTVQIIAERVLGPLYQKDGYSIPSKTRQEIASMIASELRQALNQPQ